MNLYDLYDVLTTTQENLEVSEDFSHLTQDQKEELYDQIGHLLTYLQLNKIAETPPISHT